MKRKLAGARFLFGLGTLCMILSQCVWGQTANAGGNGTNTGCGYSPEQLTQPSHPQQRRGQTENEFKSPRLVLVSGHSGQDEDNASIVGLWKIKSLLADGSVFDEGYTTWHSDGTELTNSGRPPRHVGIAQVIDGDGEVIAEGEAKPAGQNVVIAARGAGE